MSVTFEQSSPGARLLGKAPLRCAECGYEIRSYRALPPCPMCREVAWEPAPWRPFTSSRVEMESGTHGGAAPD
jgi:hypothetical protein